MQPNHPTLTVGTRHVGAGHPFFVIAEIGLNHSGHLERALAMVDAAAEAGASAIKLQTLVATELVAPTCPAPAHVTAASLTDFFAGFELDESAHRAIAARVRERGLALIATPLSLDAVDMLERVGLDAYKIASGDLTWDALITKAARTGKPLIISTGMASLGEVSHALATARLAGASAVALLHCVSAYPVPRGSENLLALRTLADAFNVPVGLSDHGDDTFAVPLVVALGASLYERHVMLEGDRDAIDGPVSSTASGLADVVATARRAALALGTGEKRCQMAEAMNVVPSRRSLYAARDLAEGELLGPDDVVALRPATGLAPSLLQELVGTRLARPVTAGSALDADDLVATWERRTA
jgi:sialic acid synthase SpsE